MREPKNISRPRWSRQRIAICISIGRSITQERIKLGLGLTLGCDHERYIAVMIFLTTT